MAGFIENPTFPLSIAFGATGGPGFLTALAAGQAGDEDREDLWAEELGAWEVGLIHKDEATTRELLAFFYCIAKGRAHSFRFRDFQPGEYTGTREFLGTGNGTTQTFQLRKWYAMGEQTYSKTIYKPVAGTARVYVNDVETTDFTLDTVRGQVTLAALGTIRASFTFDKPVRFNVDWLQIRQVDHRVFNWESIPLIEVRDPAVYLALET